MAAYDARLAQWRDTRHTGAVEAFCAFDTGHDLSARFWHVPDSPLNNDTKAYNPDNPLLPFIAPDLTANVACQRLYLARMAEELGEDAAPGAPKPSRALRLCSSSASMPKTVFSTIATATVSISACSRTCFCGSSPAKSATTRSSLQRSAAIC
ncbi:hypothetical protein N8D56_13135 [Devosia sp. A8/3-2]|nr:hypothetical protein N8D56_13135 [Devosia sp. A8/3-2]